MVGHIIFLGAFYTVVTVVLATLAVSTIRAWLHFRARRADAICWKSCFEELPAGERVCRHVFTGEFKDRVCDRAFDCRECQTHAGLVARRPEAAHTQLDVGGILGLEHPAGRFYHRGHTWVHPEPDGTATIGLDGLAARLVANPDAVEYPAPGAHLRTNGAAWYMRKRGTRVRILSPVDGQVVAVGGVGEDWYLKVKPDDADLDTRHLLCGAEVRPWLTREWDRLRQAIAPEVELDTLADGGVPVSDLAAACPEADWDSVCAEMFLQL
ncbi:MAG: hypothetical protein U0Q18_34245 [Bryobacteraceae bacterium]